MSIQLTQVYSLALPLIAIVLVQVLFISLFAFFILFRV
ncbi:sodium/glutamate symporter, partial [Staphylococcus aureus]|nr:sodium/glutamate symporter [Staphylococcus aureus]